MRREYRIDSIEISDGTVFANCYDILYDEPFKKYLGKPESENAILNAQDLLQDETFSISDEVRAEIEEIFSIKALPGVEEAYEENIEKKDTLLERLNQIDRNNNNAYDLKNLYCSCELNEADKKLVESYIDSPIRLYRFLSTKLEEEFLVEKRPSVTSVIQKDHKRGHTDNRYTSKTSSNVSSIDKMNFKRFPGGKVKIEGRYYPGIFVFITVQGKSKNEKMSYEDYSKLPNKEELKIVSYDLNLVDKEFYFKGMNFVTKKVSGYKMGVNFLALPLDLRIKEIDENEYSGLDKAEAYMQYYKNGFFYYDRVYPKSEIEVAVKVPDDGSTIICDSIKDLPEVGDPDVLYEVPIKGEKKIVKWDTKEGKYYTYKTAVHKSRKAMEIITLEEYDQFSKKLKADTEIFKVQLKK